MSDFYNIAVERARRLLARRDASLDELDAAVRAVLLSPIPDAMRDRFHEFLLEHAGQFTPAGARRMLDLLNDVYEQR